MMDDLAVSIYDGKMWSINDNVTSSTLLHSSHAPLVIWTWTWQHIIRFENSCCRAIEIIRWWSCVHGHCRLDQWPVLNISETLLAYFELIRWPLSSQVYWRCTRNMSHRQLCLLVYIWPQVMTSVSLIRFIFITSQTTLALSSNKSSLFVHVHYMSAISYLTVRKHTAN